jgi:hypothetical protein
VAALHGLKASGLLLTSARSGERRVTRVSIATRVVRFNE